MSTDTPSPPDFLKGRLQEESPDVQSDLGAVWGLLDGTGTAATDAADPGAAWDVLTEEHPEMDATPTNGSAQDGGSAPTDGSAPGAEPQAGQTEAPPTSRRRQRPAHRPDRGHSWRVAAGLAVAALVLVGGLWLWRQPVTVTAPPGQQRTATLPDGSTAHLNSGTTLTYRRSFEAWPFVGAARRAVELGGEAFFNVADGDRPFRIETASAAVTVTGTRFNVRARPAKSAAKPSAETEVTLVEGRVEVAARAQSEERVVLSEPGEKSRVAGADTAPTPPEPAATKYALAWRNSGFAARARPLTSVLQDLERRFDATLHLHDSVEETRAPVSLYYPEATGLETILHDLCTARGLNFRPTSRGFELFAAPADQQF
ncbi:FecR family protein [Salinibacter grassmerensis]|uniref:FecR family protein n=1 Tax=Salinibacter grassmerensis TaxID=3040353 RepID=UPI0021E92B91|nr:FecR domain-containing protein [Salinibacter grassmerensis]